MEVRRKFLPVQKAQQIDFHQLVFNSQTDTFSDPQRLSFIWEASEKIVFSDYDHPEDSAPIVIFFRPTEVKSHNHIV